MATELTTEQYSKLDEIKIEVLALLKIVAEQYNAKIHAADTAESSGLGQDLSERGKAVEPLDITEIMNAHRQMTVALTFEAELKGIMETLKMISSLVSLAAGGA